jgi:phenylalanyl-tRNA synthetase beta chain
MKFSLDWLKQYVDPGLEPAEVGARLTAVGIPLDSLERVGQDTVLDFDVTSNRPDCMNHLGLARELSVATGRPLRSPSCEIPPADGPAPEKPPAEVEVEAPELCGRYTARIIQGVKVGPSPDWLAGRLNAVGLRPINAVVDATNYVLWEMGHPLHAFDLARLDGRRIQVRRARPQESLTTLDGVARKLDPDMLVIADARRAVAVAGVMGGLHSEISSSTAEVLLESAHFDPASVRRTARKLGLHTDASHRFERGADVEITLPAADRCARLITEVAGGRIVPAVLDRRSAPPFHREITLRPERVCRLLGLEVPKKTMKDLLQRLGCGVQDDGASSWRVTVPSFRGDLTQEEDLIEEIARHHGYDRIPTTLPSVFVLPEGRPEAERRSRRIREAMARSGFAESVTLSFVSASDNESLSQAGPGLRITNPLAEGQDRLRGTLLPSLLRSLAHNLNHGAAEVRLFETGSIFKAPARHGELPDEEETLSLVCGGKGGLKHWSGAPQPPDLFDVKGAVEIAARSFGLPPPAWRPALFPFLARGTGAEAAIQGHPVGFIGQADPAVARATGLDEPAYLAEVSLRKLFARLPAGWGPRHRPRVRTPAVSRDLALLLDEARTYAEVEETIRGVEGVPLVKVTFFDRYRGRPVPAGKVSMAVNLVFQNPDRTLVSGEVKEMLDRIIQRLRERLGAVPRVN